MVVVEVVAVAGVAGVAVAGGKAAVDEVAKGAGVETVAVHRVGEAVLVLALVRVRMHTT